MNFVLFEMIAVLCRFLWQSESWGCYCWWRFSLLWCLNIVEGLYWWRFQMPEEELVELKFRLYDGSDIGPFRYSPASTVAMLKERIVAEWPKGQQFNVIFVFVWLWILYVVVNYGFSEGLNNVWSNLFMILSWVSVLFVYWPWFLILLLSDFALYPFLDMIFIWLSRNFSWHSLLSICMELILKSSLVVVPLVGQTHLKEIVHGKWVDKHTHFAVFCVRRAIFGHSISELDILFARFGH